LTAYLQFIIIITEGYSWSVRQLVVFTHITLIGARVG